VSHEYIFNHYLNLLMGYKSTIRPDIYDSTWWSLFSIVINPCTERLDRLSLWNDNHLTATPTYFYRSSRGAYVKCGFSKREYPCMLVACALVCYSAHPQSTSDRQQLNKVLI
jgi:hypothetical protein